MWGFFKDRIGKTLLSQAIDANNLELVTLLVDSPACARIKGIRVREHEGVSENLALSLSFSLSDSLSQNPLF